MIPNFLLAGPPPVFNPTDRILMARLRLFGIKFVAFDQSAGDERCDVEGYHYDGKVYVTKIETHPRGARR